MSQDKEKIELENLQNQLGYKFADSKLLKEALTHPSCHIEKPQKNYERLEFLGDAVLNLYVSAFLFARFPDSGEGPLSKQKAQAVCQTSCAVMMEQLNLIDHLLVGKGEQTLLAKSRPSLSSDLFEAIVGAVYVDGGWHAAERFLSIHFDAHFSTIADANPTNAKAELQELLAKQGKGLPEYKLKEMTGPPHDLLFCVAVLVAGEEFGEATGKTKREAEQRAASLALGTLHPHEETT